MVERQDHSYNELQPGLFEAPYQEQFIYEPNKVDIGTIARAYESNELLATGAALIVKISQETGKWAGITQSYLPVLFAERLEEVEKELEESEPDDPQAASKYAVAAGSTEVGHPNYEDRVYSSFDALIEKGFLREETYQGDTVYFPTPELVSWLSSYAEIPPSS